jgi:RNA polymerase sigma-70 factor (ECF subfamily)
VVEAAIAIAAEPSDFADMRPVYDEYAAYIRAVLLRLVGPRHEVDDLVQEVFLRAWTRRHIFRPGAAIRPWLTGIAVNLAAKLRRRSRLWRFFGLEAAREMVDSRTPAEALESAQDRARVYEVLERLPEKKRTVLVLHEIQGLSGEEIAQAVGCPLATVWTRLFHARRHFLTLLEQSGPCVDRSAQ